MAWRPRLVALDVDGTLVDHDMVMPESVRSAVARVVQAGCPIAIATGRGWHGAQPIADTLGLPAGKHVCSNGAVVVASPSNEVVHAITFDPREVIESVSRLAPDARIAIEEIGVGYRLNALFPDGDLDGRMTLQSLDELAAQPVTRIIIRDPQASDEDFERLARQLGLHGVSYFIGWSAWLDIAPDGVNKATGLQTLCDELGIEPGDVLALGDGRNDIEMLRWAGRGVALGDAVDEVKDAADHVTGLFADDGTALELGRWF